MRYFLNQSAIFSVLILSGLLSSNGYAQSTLTLSTAERQLLDLTNQERAKAELPPLRPDPLLFQAARGHSANMARQGKMDHVLDEKDPFQRIQETGYRFSWAGENIAYGYLGMEQVLRVWMDSPGHRQNILNPNYTQIGLGRVLDENGVPYYTQVFGTPALSRSRD